jgi:hypothetical protein
VFGIESKRTKVVKGKKEIGVEVKRKRRAHR